MLELLLVSIGTVLERIEKLFGLGRDIVVGLVRLGWAEWVWLCMN